MKRLAIAAVAVVALAGSLTATAAQTNSPKHGTGIVAPPTPCDHHPHPTAEHRVLAAKTFDYSHWRSPAPGDGAVETAGVLRGCVGARPRKAMLADWAAERADLGLQRRYRLVATEPGFVGEGRFLRWLPIPAYIVACETEGYSGEGRWTATNPDGDAQGPAQVKAMHGAPRPASTPAERVAYWEVTAGLWASSGSGAWACA